MIPQVAMVTPNYLPVFGGIQYHVNGLSKAISDYGWNINIHAAVNRVCQNHETGNVHIKYYKTLLRPLNNPVTASMFFSLMQDRSNVLHVHGLYQSTAFISKAVSSFTDRPIVATFHGRPSYENALDTMQTVFERTLLKTAAEWFHSTIALTQSDKEFLLKSGFKQKQIRVIPNAIDVSFWSNGRGIHNETLKQIEGNLLYVGWLNERKNCGTIIEAFSKLPQRHSKIKLFLIGSGSSKAKLINQVRKYGLQNRVIFLGNVTREFVRYAYKVSKCLVLASKSEGLPTVVLETMAAGTPVLVSPLPGLLEFISGGQNGFLFKKLDSDSVAAKISDVLDLEKGELASVGNSGYHTVKSRYDWPVVAKSVIEVYRDAISFQ